MSYIWGQSKYIWGQSKNCEIKQMRIDSSNFYSDPKYPDPKYHPRYRVCAHGLDS